MHGRYSPLKVFRYPGNALPVERDRLHAPIHVRIKPVNACNQRCWYCAYREDQLALGSGMNLRDSIPREKMAEIVEDLIAMGVRAVTFSGGGEPLIYRYLPETIRKLAAGGVKVASLTNGWALRGDVAEALAEHATWIRVSIDGWDGASYARSRHVPETAYGDVMENVRTFIGRTHRCAIGFSFIVDRDNASHIFEFCREAKASGAQHVKLSACIVSNHAAENNAYHAVVQEVVKEQIRLARGLDDERFQVIDHYHAMPERFEQRFENCPMLEFLTVIGADCAVYTCQDKAYAPSGALGSIRDRSFSELWFSPLTAARVRSFNPSVSCNHHCTAHAKNALLTEFRALDSDHAAFV